MAKKVDINLIILYQFKYTMPKMYVEHLPTAWSCLPCQFSTFWPFISRSCSAQAPFKGLSCFQFVSHHVLAAEPAELWQLTRNYTGQDHS